MAAQAFPETTNAANSSAKHAGTGTELRLNQLTPPSDWPATGKRQAPVLLVRAWVNAILHFWRLQLDAGALDPQQPLYLIDPAPGDGVLAVQILHALDDVLGHGATPWKPCYIACHRQAQQGNWLSSHPWLTPYRQRDCFDTALLTDYTSTGLHLQGQGVTVLRAANPLVLLGWQWLGQFACDLVGSEHGQLWDGQVTLNKSDGTLDYHWHKCDPATMPQPYPHLLQDCRDNTVEVAMPIPADACSALDYLTSLSAGNYLLLAADHGISNLQQLRLHLAALPQVWPPEHGRLPVNYHGLALHQRLRGATTWNNQTCDDGMVLHTAYVMPDNVPGQELLEVIADPLAEAHPDLAQQMVLLAAPAHSQDATALLRLLKLSGYDPAVLQAGMNMLQEQASQLINTRLQSWQHALQHTWNNYVPTASDDGFIFAFGALAARLGCWGLAKTCLHDGMALYGMTLHGLHHLAVCHAVTGERQRALQLLALAIDTQPDDAYCLELRAHLRKQHEAILATVWYAAEIATDDQLTLEPLGPEHAESLFYQYRDRQIGIMTRLPELNSVAETSAWIAQQHHSEGRYCCAVIHASWGFIGMVSLQRGDHMGYFYFWMGSDFQDRGWGKKAARLFFAQAARNGMTDLFTAAYQNNVRSRKALLQLGFQEMALRAEAPEEDLVFYQLPLSVAPALDRDDEDIKVDKSQSTSKFLRLCALIDFRIVCRSNIGQALSH